MKKVILTFGLIAGAISASLMMVTTIFADRIGFDRGVVVGYATIVLSSLVIFFGVRSYRDNVSDGTVTFGRAFLVGLGIAVISCICYVVVWEVVYYNFMPDFMDKYAAYQVTKLKASGADVVTVQKQLDGIARMKVLYANPLYNAAMTFLEPFPVTLLVTLGSAVILRRSKPRVPQSV
ncbi:DUF4199 domain-containing protein [Terriglobus albidus]|uniref:DUF4199 domain-containing protein n=1 Tax=Terriglobus albidus TaxID=1592106 RepID=A0A5B9ED50_9BACT|nr:DUF4199 domain-containing protein [Terriglobus albidus]QEE29992.1 DUF4199 domain-containing protein [Terriglobus albidus]